MRETDCSNYQTKVDKDKVVVDITTVKDILAKPKWDNFENNHFAMRRRLVSIFLRASNKLICRIRAGKRLQKIWAWINSENIKSREEMKGKVEVDAKNSKNQRQEFGSDSANDIRNCRFTFGFNAENVKKGLMKLPLEYETNITSFLEKVEANPPTNFDDLIMFDPLEVLDFEIQKYQPQ